MAEEKDGNQSNAEFSMTQGNYQVQYRSHYNLKSSFRSKTLSKDPSSLLDYDQGGKDLGKSVKIGPQTTPLFQKESASPISGY